MLKRMCVAALLVASAAPAFAGVSPYDRELAAAWFKGEKANAVAKPQAKQLPQTPKPCACAAHR